MHHLKDKTWISRVSWGNNFAIALGRTFIKTNEWLHESRILVNKENNSLSINENISINELSNNNIKCKSKNKRLEKIKSRIWPPKEQNHGLKSARSFSNNRFSGFNKENLNVRKK